MTLSAGTRLGTYEILDAIGAGGMGEVYRARDTKLGRDVAIKILPSAFAQDPDRLARFGREARLLASLNHANIATIHGIEESGEIRGLVLELVDGETLADRIAAAKGRGVPLDEALPIARQIVDALDAAHQAGIIHRDLKPANIKITRNGIVKVLDFGIAKGISGEARDESEQTATTVGTRQGLILGTVAYMSPEQARGQEVDKRTDIWAFGCVLYEMLAGRPAFGRPTTSDTVVAVLEHEPDWRACPASTPLPVVRLMRRCLTRNLERRLRDIADARFDLEETLSGGSPSVAPSSRLAGSRLLVWSAAGALAGAAGMALVLMTLQRPSVNTAPRLSRPVKITNSAAQEFGPAIAPDGKWVAYYANTEGRTDLWVKFLDSGASTNLTAGLNLELPARTGIGGVAISTDGSQIAFAARPDPAQPSYDTWVIPAPVGGAPHKLLQVLQGLQWSPDGKQIIGVRPGSTVGDTLVLGERDGTSLRDLVPAVAGRHIHWPAWSPDGQFIYFIHTYETWHSEPSEIYRVSVKGGAVEPAVLSSRRAVYPVPLAGGELLFAANADTVDLGLWWKPRAAAAPQPLTMGLGEYTEPRLSADGRKIVATLVDVRQALVRLPLAEGLDRLVSLTDGHTGDIDPSLDPHTDRLVFSSARSGTRNLWIARADGTDARPLTMESASEERPVFSPDGADVAFVSNRSGRQAIWVISASGGAPKMLTETIVLDSLTWSADGTHVIFARPEGQRTGLAEVRVADGKLDPIATPAQACCPAASPIRDVIAYLQPTLLKAQGASGSPTARLWLRFIDGQGRPLYSDLPDQQFANGVLAWSPDGKRLAGASISSAGASSLWIVEPGTPKPFTKLAEFPAIGRPRGLTWTRDGTSVIFAQQQFPGDIVMFDVIR